MGMPRLPQQGPAQDERHPPHLRVFGRKFLERRQDQGNKSKGAAPLIKEKDVALATSFKGINP